MTQSSCVAILSLTRSLSLLCSHCDFAAHRSPLTTTTLTHLSSQQSNVACRLREQSSKRARASKLSSDRQFVSLTPNLLPSHPLQCVSFGHATNSIVTSGRALLLLPASFSFSFCFSFSRIGVAGLTAKHSNKTEKATSIKKKQLQYK